MWEETRGFLAKRFPGKKMPAFRKRVMRNVAVERFILPGVIPGLQSSCRDRMKPGIEPACAEALNSMRFCR